MRAISLWQPWASAIARGVKGIETRSWSTPYRGPILIHAAQRWTEDQRRIAIELGMLLPVPDFGPKLHDHVLPVGYLVAVTEIIDVKPTTEILKALPRREYIAGNYAPGRYGWILGRTRALKTPVRFKGRQGMFLVPNELIEDQVPSWALI